MRSFQSSESNRTFDTKTEAGDEEKGDVICVRDSDSYGVEIGWVLQIANEKGSTGIEPFVLRRQFVRDANVLPVFLASSGVLF